MLSYTSQDLENQRRIHILKRSMVASIYGCLNVNRIISLEDAEEKIEVWRHEFNHFRLHNTLNNLILWKIQKLVKQQA